MAPIRQCATCGTALPEGAPAGQCPECLIQLGLQAGVASASDPTDGGFGLLPREFGDYILLEEIARGGMGVVFKARQISLNRIVAVKMILAGHFAGPDSVRRFRTEAEATARLRHANIVAIHEIDEHDGQQFFSMDYIEGQNLADAVRERPMSAKRAAALLQAVAEAIHYAHGQGLLHRDLKPSNILIDADDRPHVTDFGLAKRLVAQTVLSAVSPTGSRLGGKSPATLDLSATSAGSQPAIPQTDSLRYEENVTLTGQVLGSPNYISPEQASGKRGQVSRQSDVYSLGAILYYLLTGRGPFVSDTVAETLQQVLHEEPVAPRLLHPAAPRDLETICLKCLEKEPARRYATAQELADELGRFLRDEPIHARPAGRWEKAWRWCRRNPALAGSLGAAALLLLVVGIGSPIAAYRINQQRRQAQKNLVQQYVANGNRLMKSGDSFGSLLWYTEALRQDSGNAAREEPHRIRIASVLQNCPRLSHVITHGSVLFDARLTPDGRHLITSADDGTARIWDLTTGEPRLVLRHPQNANILVTSCSPDSRWVATVAMDKTVRVWDVQSGIERHSPLHHETVVKHCAFSPDGRRVVTCDQSGAVSLWEASTGERQGTPLPHQRGVWTAAFSQDGRWLATTESGWNTIVWDLKTHERRLQTQDWDTPGFLSFSPDSRQFVTCSGFGVRVWNLTTFKEEPFSPMHHTSNAKCAVFGRNGRWIASAGEDRVIRIWDAATGRQVAVTPESETARYHAATFSPDGRYVVGSGDSSVCNIWDLRDGLTAMPVLHQPAPVRKAVFHPDGRRLLVLSADQKVRIWDLATQSSPLPSRPHLEDQRRLFTHDGQRMLTLGPTNSLWIADTRDGRPLIILPHAGKVSFATFSPDAKTVLSACAAAQLCDTPVENVSLWDALTGRNLSGTNMYGVSPMLYAAFSPDGRRVLICGVDSGARVWNLSSASPVTPILRHSHRVHWGAFDPGGKRVVTASSDRMVSVWDAKSGEPLTQPLPHPHRVVGAEWSRDGHRIRTFMSLGQIQIWDLDSGGPLTLPMETVAFPLSTTASPGLTESVSNLPADRRPVADLVKLSQLLSASRVDDRGIAIALGPDRWSQLYQELRPHIRKNSVPSPKEIVAWHEARADALREKSDEEASRFHLRQAMLVEEGNPGRLAESEQRNTRRAETPLSNRGRRIRRETVPPRDPSLPPTLVDLSQYFNSSLTRDHGNDFSELRTGRQFLAGVPFDIRGVIVLAGKSLQGSIDENPARVDHIAIGLKARRLNFLHGMEYDANDGDQVGTYILHYADGEVRELPILTGRHLWGWYGMPETPVRTGDAVVAWAGSSRATLINSTFVRLYKSTHENPRPDAEITSIDFVSSMAFPAPFLVALTVE